MGCPWTQGDTLPLTHRHCVYVYRVHGSSDEFERHREMRWMNESSRRRNRWLVSGVSKLKNWLFELGNLKRLIMLRCRCLTTEGILCNVLLVLV